MRRILVDAARRKQREKHGGDRTRIDLEAAAPVAPDFRHDLVALDAALTKLAAEDPQAARLVELRHFAGLSIPEAAAAWESRRVLLIASGHSPVPGCTGN